MIDSIYYIFCFMLFLLICDVMFTLYRPASITSQTGPKLDDFETKYEGFGNAVMSF